MQLKKKIIISIIVICSLLFISSGLLAHKSQQKILQLGTGKSELLKVVDLERAAVADPEVADIVTISQEELLINGKSEGTTTLHLWDQKGHRSYQVEVYKEEARVIKQIKELIGTDTVKVAKVEENIILSGKVRDQTQLQRVKKIAGVFGEKVINELQVTNSLQVLLAAQVFEIDKAVSEELGFDWYSTNSGGVESGTATLGETTTSRFGIGHYERLYQLRTKLKALIEDGKAKLLAKPKLVTKSGQKASFNVGGEIPVVTADSSGEQTVVWKNYGVQFEVEPTVTPTGKLETYLHPKVSQLDWANAVDYGNSGQLPAIKSSEVKTQVVIKDGAALAIGGLLQQYRSEDIKRIPLLSQLPILGELFKSKSFREEKSELIILVTPKIIASESDSREAMEMEETLEKKENEGSKRGE
ncbi:type II and III secretion system protein family protein [Acetohalobium arabaticum]|uniref:Type II and III secretion system protein n=1 Tax=Acetohalobium arabaticum (strain ATCC 49924 / DSM 5501 / Z-7288) TaxID=574087 RepID=D9QTM0_ACEAZ|nr:pilus assembly protein N-terminal domain-containing protein [Acetohalobium arabaticum]ADL11784.1 type II and III secretion system protein [Acetohalobium arabaticum DSM 5501]